jgi:hypothetical protein
LKELSLQIQLTSPPLSQLAAAQNRLHAHACEFSVTHKEQQLQSVLFFFPCKENLGENLARKTLKPLLIPAPSTETIYMVFPCVLLWWASYYGPTKFELCCAFKLTSRTHSLIRAEKWMYIQKYSLSVPCWCVLSLQPSRRLATGHCAGNPRLHLPSQRVLKASFSSTQIHSQNTITPHQGQPPWSKREAALIQRPCASV